MAPKNLMQSLKKTRWFYLLNYVLQISQIITNKPCPIGGYFVYNEGENK